MSATSERYAVVSEANRRCYGRPGAGDEYDKTHFLNEGDLAVLDADLRRALDRLGHPARRRAVALDACGGTGNAALRLQEMGCDTHLVDISEEMIETYRRRCRERGFPASAESGEILSFFGRNTRKYDLIVFSSALHHLEDPLLVLRHAQTALSPGGLIVTVFDPVAQSRLTRILFEPVRLLDRAIAEPGKIATRFVPVVRRLLRGGSARKHGHVESVALTDQNVGNVAEFHADTGIDDLALAEQIGRTTKLRVVHHDRHSAPWGYVTPYVLTLFRKPTNFRFLLENAAPE